LEAVVDPGEALWSLELELLAVSCTRELLDDGSVSRMPRTAQRTSSCTLLMTE